jgi:hypothetical protein
MPPPIDTAVADLQEFPCGMTWKKKEVVGSILQQVIV